MSYEYTNAYKDTLGFKPSIVGPDEMLISVQVGSAFRGVHIPKADVPTVAAELLKAAGRDDLGGYLTAVVEKEAAAAEWAANEAEKKLQERRDVLAKLFSHGVNFSQQHHATRRAIDAYIELEDKLAAK